MATVSLRTLVNTSARLYGRIRPFTTSENHTIALQRIASQLEYATEMALTASDSARLLLLETDASNRQPRDTYVLHYQALAMDQLQSALRTVEELKSQVELEEWDNILRHNKPFAVQLADVMLLRDNVSKSVRDLERRLRDNIVDCQD